MALLYLYKNERLRGLIALPPKRFKKRWLVFLTLVICSVLFIFGQQVIQLILPDRQIEHLKKIDAPSWIDQQYITNGYPSRNGQQLSAVNDIVIHYVGNPGTTAQQNRNYFDTPTTTVSSHFVIGLDGEIIQTLPLYEKSAATNWRNDDTISIEVTHPTADGQFTEASYDALVRLTAWLLHSADLPPKQVIRHYDVTGKPCPLYYVQHDDAWLALKEDIRIAYDAI